jgi:hypothetical protein
MKKLIIVSTLVLLAISGYGQTTRNYLTYTPSLTDINFFSIDKNTAPTATTRPISERFAQFRISELPAVVNSSDILPAGYTNLQVNFNENKLIAQIGSYRDNANDAFALDRRFSMGIEFTCDANEKSLNLFELLDGKNEYTVNPKVSFLIDGKVTEDNNLAIVKQRFLWANGSYKYSNSIFELYSLNNNTFSFEETKFTGHTGSLSINGYKFSGEKGLRHRLLNGIASLGVTFGNTNNYAGLQKDKFKSYETVANNNSTTEYKIKEFTGVNKSSYIADNKISFILNAELQKHLLFTEYSTIFLSTSMHYNVNTNVFSLSVGPSFNIKKRNPVADGTGGKKDAINVALILDMPGLTSNYDLRKTGGLYLRTAIPLLFHN